jgi:alkanesulfonate monooxygenase SsuD/methylene tetrahydromethanopterin reductase-like flavin-dependent oxidoreductase (luciferase family)
VKVGVLQFFSWPERRVPLSTVYQRALQRIDVMDRTGYDAVWLAEHHFSTYSVCPSVHVMGTHVAGRTSRLRIGTAVTLGAFYHPLRIAEEVALLDVLSDGRVNWGVGRGFDKTEYQAFDVTAEESYPRFRENVDIVRQAWTNERLTYDGDYWHFDDVEVLPKPQQVPSPPIWIASTSTGAIEWSARQGYSILMDPHSTHTEIGEKRRLYDDTLAAAGHPVGGRDIPVARLLAVASTSGEAEEIARRGAQWITESYANPDHQIDRHSSAPGSTATDRVGRYVEQVVLWGTPEKLVDQLQELRETISLEYLMCAPLSHSTFELFTERVLPKLV